MLEKSGIESLGVRVINSEQNITLEGKTYADLILFEHLRVENLRRCVAALGVANPHAVNELLIEVQTQLQAMQNASAGVLHEHLCAARAQGLRFEIVPQPDELH